MSNPSPGTYHTYSICTLQHSLLKCIRTKSMLLSSIKETMKLLSFDLIAYVICDSEFHMIIRTLKDGASLPLIMKDIKYKFTRKYNAAFNNKGTTWSRRYGRNQIESSSDPAGYFKWLTASLAAVQNVEPHLIHAKTNRFSSINTFFVQGFKPELDVKPHWIFQQAGRTGKERIREFKRFAEIYRETKFLGP